MKELGLFLLVVGLFGCAGISDVVRTGPDTYMVESHGTMGWSSGSAQKARAFQKADAFCAKSGKVVKVISTDEKPSGFGKIASGEVQFRCVEPGKSEHQEDQKLESKGKFGRYSRAAEVTQEESQLPPARPLRLVSSA